MPEGRALVQPPAVVMNARRIVAVGTGIWFVAFLALLPFYTSLGHQHPSHRVWLWTCLAGTFCGLAGWSLMVRHRRLGRTI
jgi:RsiW-degrading membrane proteinase PrsW (M82 family)